MYTQKISFFKKTLHLSRDSGFTLIELMVVFSIIAVLSGISMAAFTSYSRSQRLNQTASNIKLLISEAKFNSLSTVKTITTYTGTTATCGNETLIGYAINILGNDQLELNLLCTNTNATRVKLMIMPNGYTFGNGTTCSQMQFASLSATPAGLPCVIKLTGNGQTKTISIDAIGNTSIQ